MNDRDALAAEFETHRAHLRAVAYRMLGSAGEAEDAVQEAWLRLGRADAAEIGNLRGWLTTVVARVCLDLLRSRKSRREHYVGLDLPEAAHPGAATGPAADRDAAARARTDPEESVMLAESVGQALLVVLESLSPVERVVFILHDTFGVPFAEIAPVVGRTPAATKKLASRARGKVRSEPDDTAAPTRVPGADLARHRRVVEAFLNAVRVGDVDTLLHVLAPGVVRTADPAALPVGAATRVSGIESVIEETRHFAARAQAAELVLVDGAPGLVVAHEGRPFLAVTFTIDQNQITAYDVVADPARLAGLALAVLDE
jgi:RNA polymerase sigma factor (sigma-70 family)